MVIALTSITCKYIYNCERRHSKKVFECSRTKREPIHSKTVKPFSNGAVHNYKYVLN